MANCELINPEPEDFESAEAIVGPLPGENDSPCGARVLYEAAQAHKLIRHLKDLAQRLSEGV